MSGHYATGEVWVGNLGSADEADEVQRIVEAVLASAGYEATVSVTATAYAEEG